LEVRGEAASQTVKLPTSLFQPAATTFDTSIELTGETPAGNRQSRGSSCDRHVPVAHLLVLLRVSTDDRACSASPPPKPAFFGGNEPV